MLWQPNPGVQTRFLASRADRGLYGGAAGGGKSQALLALPLRHIGNPNYRGLYLRRESQYLGDAIDKSRRLYPALGGKLVLGPRILWTFPSGAELWLNHCAHENDIANYDSFEFGEVLFDELTHFTERQFDGICARLRGTDPTLPYHARAGTNPGGVGHDWVFRRWGAWLDPRHERPAAPGERRWYIGREEVPKGTPDALSYTFFPARLSDNPRVDPSYRAQILAMADPVRRKQLDEGDWLVKPSEGLYFPKTAWRWLDHAPPVVRRVRAWDLAATVDGDWTVGVLMGVTAEGLYAVLDVVRFRGGPDQVRATILATAARDDHGTTVVVPQDPGQAGVDQAQGYVRALAGYSVRTRRPSANKVLRATPFSAQARGGNVAVVRATWSADFVDELAGFPLWEADDQVDAAADAFATLAGVGGSADLEAWMNDLAAAGVGQRRETSDDSTRPPSERDEDEDDDGRW